MGRSTARPGARWGLAVALGGVLIFSACGGDDGEADKSAKGEEADTAPGTPVGIVNFLYDPQEIQVAPGTKVTWTNKDTAPHNVQDLSDLNLPISRDLAQGESFSITYEKPGSYPYVCGLHTWMTGTVKVV
jgi:plastocyanin